MLLITLGRHAHTLGLRPILKSPEAHVEIALVGIFVGFGAVVGLEVVELLRGKEIINLAFPLLPLILKLKGA